VRRRPPPSCMVGPASAACPLTAGVRPPLPGSAYSPPVAYLPSSCGAYVIWMRRREARGQWWGGGDAERRRRGSWMGTVLVGLERADDVGGIGGRWKLSVMINCR
jgi:hypothetical protein